MWLINLAISLFGIIKTKALECVSVVNQKCMPKPKIFDVNEGVGEALFYPYNLLINKCSGSCDTINNSMAKLCVPGIIKRVNMKVYNFLMMLNETRSVLWHESCKCVCKLNSSVCNNKQIWNMFIGLFPIVMFILIVCFCVFFYFKWLKNKKNNYNTSYKNGY